MMATSPSDGPGSIVQKAARRARAASRSLARLPNERRAEVLLAVARAMESKQAELLRANERDLAAAESPAVVPKISPALLARLRLSERGIEEMAARVREVARLPDPLGRRLSAMELDDGLILYKESCPLGVIGVVFESRPDVIPQVAALALKSGNSVILKGGREAACTNQAILFLWRECIRDFPDVPAESIHLLHTREDVEELLTLDKEIDLVIPRGSRELVEFVTRHSRIPVLGHGEGMCHVYVDRAADIEKALAITLDSKVQYPAACNAAETLLVHEDVASGFLPQLVVRLRSVGVELRGCSRTVALVASPEMYPASETDWATEYSDLILSIRIVSTVQEAITHIERFGSRHTETIVTEDGQVAELFLREVDAAGVFHNASTRFSDGYRYGLGAELGISTTKLHARGPVGLEGLTTYKYKLYGDGHTVAQYSKGERQFKHRPLR
jgi:glutamate-5-semialdehyde dehydrogenase